MSWVDSITPKNTEEDKPGLFIQEKRGKLRQVHPAAWNGKVNWKNFLLGHDFLKNLIVFAIIMFVAYGFYQGTHACTEFQEDPCKHLANITNYCNEKFNQDLNLYGFIKDGETNLNALQSYP